MNVQTSYDRVAAEYARHYFHELEPKPLDRGWLDRLAQLTAGQGPVCDLGCGPGEVARYLRDHGVTEVFGLDLSPGMVAQARQLSPDIDFQTGDMLALPAPAQAWAGIAAFYCLCHLPLETVPRALAEMFRVLKPGGWLLLAFHLGAETLHADEMWAQPVNLDFYLFQRADIELALRAAGFAVTDSFERAPYPEVEYQGPRGYLFARKPVGG